MLLRRFPSCPSSSSIHELLSLSSSPLRSTVPSTRPAFLRRLPQPSTSFVRHATHKAQGSTSQKKDGAGKRLGAKKTGEQYVIPGNIIFRQRGTHWFPGANVGMGRDHTIFATHAGYVKYYRDPHTHPKRKYIGVVFEREHELPHPPHAARRRRLGLVPVELDADAVAAGEAASAAAAENAKPAPLRQGQRQKKVERTPTLRPGYMYREANWEIGRAAERAGVRAEAYKSRDRFAAWRKTAARKAKNAERRGLRGKR